MHSAPIQPALQSTTIRSETVATRSPASSYAPASEGTIDVSAKTSAQGMTEEGLLRLQAEQLEELRLLRERSSTVMPGGDDSLEIGRSAFRKGKTLQRFVFSDLAASMPGLGLTAPLAVGLLSIANDFLRLGSRLMSGVGSGVMSGVAAGYGPATRKARAFRDGSIDS